MQGVRDGLSLRCAIRQDHLVLQEGPHEDRAARAVAGLVSALDALQRDAVGAANAAGAGAIATDAETAARLASALDEQANAGVDAADAGDGAEAQAASRQAARSSTSRGETARASGIDDRLRGGCFLSAD